MSNRNILLGGTFLTILFAAVLFWPREEPGEKKAVNLPAPQKENTLHSVSNPEAVQVTMYKNPGCGCCTKWAEHMVSEESFEVREIAASNIYEIKAEAGIPRELSSCHTAKIGGYFVEGHVPMEQVKRLLEEQPDAVGLTVPGMPIGSPGMEVDGRNPAPYDVLLIRKDGSTEVFASYNK
jgi:hypothetical protein